MLCECGHNFSKHVRKLKHDISPRMFYEAGECSDCLIICQDKNWDLYCKLLKIENSHCFENMKKTDLDLLMNLTSIHYQTEFHKGGFSFPYES